MKTILLVAITFFFMSCENKAMKKPPNLISEDQMVDILYDMMLLNSAKGINKQLLEETIQNPEQYIYNIFVNHRRKNVKMNWICFVKKIQLIRILFT